jgi:hypothetical protein
MEGISSPPPNFVEKNLALQIYHNPLSLCSYSHWMNAVGLQLLSPSVTYLQLIIRIAEEELDILEVSMIAKKSIHALG